jgi:hypothetical protein
VLASAGRSITLAAWCKVPAIATERFRTMSSSIFRIRKAIELFICITKQHAAVADAETIGLATMHEAATYEDV